MQSHQPTLDWHVRGAWSGWLPTLRVGLVNALDALIALQLALALDVVVAGGFHLGFLSVTTAAKPALWVILLVLVRMGLGGPSWVTRRLWDGVRACTESRAISAIPAPMRDVCFALMVSWLATTLIGFVANLLLEPDRARPFPVRLPWARLTETFAVWDSGWYFDIASRGYYYSPTGQSSIAFFPLYPMLMRLVAAPFGGSETAIWAAGIIVSCTAFALALMALHRLTERLTGSREVARRTVLYVAIFPFSIYFVRVYTEALFLLWTVLAVLAAHDSKWARAGLFGALAALTRPNGMIIALPLAIMAFSGSPPIAVYGRRLLALIPIPLAVGAYSAFVYTLAGRPLAWFEAQRHWDYTIGRLPYRHFLNGLSAIEEYGLYGWLLRSESSPFDFFYSILALAFLALVPLVVRRLGPAMGAYVLVSLLIPLSGSAFVGIGRYVSVLFPAFIVMGTISSARGHEAILVVSALFHAFFLALLVTWHPLI